MCLVFLFLGAERVVGADAVDFSNHQLLPQLALVFALSFLERIVVVSVQDFKSLHFAAAVAAEVAGVGVRNRHFSLLRGHQDFILPRVCVPFLFVLPLH